MTRRQGQGPSGAGVTGIRFFDDLLGQYKMHAGIPGEQQFVSRQFAARMESPATKRILFDSR